MSRCGKTEHLEALVLGELSLARATQVEQHTLQCAACKHELNWLKSERLMFEQRLARDTVQQLWVDFAAKRDAPAEGPARSPEESWPARQNALGRWALAMAASAVLLIGVGSRLQSSRLDEGLSFEASSAPMSLEEMSRDLGPQGRDCSQLQPGTGFACGPFLPASFAMRE